MRMARLVQWHNPLWCHQGNWCLCQISDHAPTFRQLGEAIVAWTDRWMESKSFHSPCLVTVTLLRKKLITSTSFHSVFAASCVRFWNINKIVVFLFFTKLHRQNYATSLVVISCLHTVCGLSLLLFLFHCMTLETLTKQSCNEAAAEQFTFCSRNTIIIIKKCRKQFRLKFRSCLCFIDPTN